MTCLFIHSWLFLYSFHALFVYIMPCLFVCLFVCLLHVFLVYFIPYLFVCLFVYFMPCLFVYFIPCLFHPLSVCLLFVCLLLFHTSFVCLFHVSFVCYRLLQDRSTRYERMFHNRKALEDDWSKAASVKKQREHEERQHTRTPGQLLHEQCDRYGRCGQCKRTLGNCGESNIWRESRYIPGSRLMV